MDGATSEREEGSSTQWNGIRRKGSEGNDRETGAIDEVKVKAPLVCWCAPYLYTSESEKKNKVKASWSGLVCLLLPELGDPVFVRWGPHRAGSMVVGP